MRISRRSRSNVRGFQPSVAERLMMAQPCGGTFSVLLPSFLPPPRSTSPLGLYRRVVHGFHDVPCLFWFCSLSVALIATAQRRWRVATRAFNRDKRSCHEAGSGITIRELESVYRCVKQFICIEANAPGVVALHTSLIFPSFSYSYFCHISFSLGRCGLAGSATLVSIQYLNRMRIPSFRRKRVSIYEGSRHALHAEYLC